MMVIWLLAQCNRHVLHKINTIKGNISNVICILNFTSGHLLVESSGGAPTPPGTSVFTKHNWDMGMGHLWPNGLGVYDSMGGAFMV